MAILRIARDASPSGAGISIREALRRTAYAGLRPTFKAGDLRPLIFEDPALVDDWLAYSEDKRTSGGCYVLRTGEIGQVGNSASRTTYPSIQEAIAEFVVRELDYWLQPDEFPPGWSKTISDLFAEAKESRQPVGPPETDWARAYERSLLRPWARFPLDGEIYEALEETPVRFLTHWRAPFTGGGDGVLPKGTGIRVKVADWNREPIGVYADPLDRPRIEQLLVPKADRDNPRYAAVSLSIPTADLNRLYRLVTSDQPALSGTPNKGAV